MHAQFPAAAESGWWMCGHTVASRSTSSARVRPTVERTKSCMPRARLLLGLAAAAPGSPKTGQAGRRGRHAQSSARALRPPARRPLAAFPAPPPFPSAAHTTARQPGSSAISGFETRGFVGRIARRRPRGGDTCGRSAIAAEARTG